MSIEKSGPVLKLVQGVRSAYEGVLNYALNRAQSPKHSDHDVTMGNDNNSSCMRGKHRDNNSDTSGQQSCTDSAIGSLSSGSSPRSFPSLSLEPAPRRSSNHHQASSVENEVASFSSGTTSVVPEKNPYCATMYDIIELNELCVVNRVHISDEVVESHLWERHQIMKKGANKRIHVRWDDNDEFEIDKLLLAHTAQDGTPYYLVKWQGWSAEHNTWEPLENVQHCTAVFPVFNAWWDVLPNDKKLQRQKLAKELFQEYFHHKKSHPRISVNKVKKALIGNGTVRVRGLRKSRKGVDVNDPEHRDMRRAQLKTLKEWEDELNRRCSDPAGICVENNVDLDGPPTDFTYINDYIAGPGVNLSTSRIVSCKCTDCFSQKDGCCPGVLTGDFGYSRKGKVAVRPNSFIYECCDACACGADCPNKTVQVGRKVTLTIFKTKNKGWGVKTTSHIPKGTFMCVYNGEVITHDEAERRGKMYDPVGRTYLLDLEFCNQVTSQIPYTVDAGTYGNLSHFLNHCCDPNLSIYGVFTNTIHLQFPKMAMFANRDIKKGEELTFDYQMTGDSTSLSLLNTSRASDIVKSKDEICLYSKADIDLHGDGGGEDDRPTCDEGPGLFSPKCVSYASDDVNMSNNQLSPLYMGSSPAFSEMNHIGSWSLGSKRPCAANNTASWNDPKRPSLLQLSDTSYSSSQGDGDTAVANSPSVSFQLVLNESSSDSGGKLFEISKESPIIPGNRRKSSADTADSTEAAETPRQLRNTPREGVRTPDKGVGTPDKGVGTPDKGVGTPGKGACTPGKGACTPDKGAYTLDKGADTPCKGACIPDKGVSTPGKGACTPGKGACTPGKGACTLDKGVRTPIQEDQPPVKGQRSLKKQNSTSPSPVMEELVCDDDEESPVSLKRHSTPLSGSPMVQADALPLNKSPTSILDKGSAKLGKEEVAAMEENATPSQQQDAKSTKTANSFRMACHCGAKNCRKWLW